MNQSDGHTLKLSRRDLLCGAMCTAGALLTERHLHGLVASTGLATGAPSITGARCEDLLNPLGLQTPDPRLCWSFGECGNGVRQVAYQIGVSSRPNGPSDLWDSGRVESTDVAIQYAGKPLRVHGEAYWTVRSWLTGRNVPISSPTSRWSLGPLDETEWAGSRWIARDVLLESTQAAMPGDSGLPKEPGFFPAPYLRTEFSISKPVRSALLYASGVGYAELHLNGRKIDEQAERNPGFTNYDKRVLYVTHDVTSLLQTGKNAIGAILGTGWYDVHDVATWHFNTAPWRQRPRLRVMMVLQYADGTTSFVVSDEGWCSAAGPILRDGIYTGEVYDARRELSGWSKPGYDASLWSAVLVVDPPMGRLIPLACEPIRITETIAPINIAEPRPGIFIINMGQNFSGHTQLRVKGPAGSRITLRYGELLNPDGTLNTAPIDRFMMHSQPRQPFQQDTYICKGAAEEEVWESRFSYSGFQYVEVTNFPGTPTVDNFRGRFAHTDMPAAGEFHCSSDIANRIQHATRWSYLSNAQSYPTDCPQREKNGWTGDAGLAVECGLMNFQSAAFYRKWLLDFKDAQRPDGGLPVLVPNGGWGNGESWPGELCPPWDAAYPLVAWNVFRYSGDLRILREHVEPLRRYVEFFLSHRAANGLVPGLGLGDWAPWKTETPLDFITNAYLNLDLTLLANIYGALGDKAAEVKYRAVSSSHNSLFQSAFYDSAKHQYSNGSQTAQATALYFGLVPHSEQAAVLADLARNVEQLGHLDVGILGAKHLLRALSEGGRTDLAFRIATQTAVPGWGYWINAGATTLLEEWDAGPSGSHSGFGSYNHIMFGDVSAWFYAWIAGVQQEKDSIGFERILFCPNPVGGLTNARGSYLTPRGRVVLEWTEKDSAMHLTVEVPCGSSGRLVLPAGAKVVSTSYRNKKEPSSPQGNTAAFVTSGRHQIHILLNAS